MLRFIRLFTILAVLFLSDSGWNRANALQSTPTITVLDRKDQPVNRITDANLIRLRVDVGNALPTVTSIVFKLQDVDDPVASCTIAAGEASCLSDSLNATGWYWGPGASPGNAGKPMPERALLAVAPDGQVLANTSIEIQARPVVMVHGFSSDYTAWNNYLGPQGYLARIGVAGYAVGDGQVPGVMNTGQIANPLGRTNTIAQNAAILRDYIAAVKKKTGAERVDLLAHSMGGMISRYYIDRLMQERDVVQLMMLGSPSLGTACANLPASLGYYLPATLEIQPEYAFKVFNPQITHRHGIAFSILAGDPIANPAGSPCTGVPSDLVISQHSATGIPLDAKELPILHIELNTSELAFDGYVKPLLQKGPGSFPDEPDPENGTIQGEPIQFGQIYSGHIDSGQEKDISIPIEAGVQVASFGLYDPSQSLTVEVRGASGNVIELTTEKNSLIEVRDPRSMIYLGYGFNQPKPGVWIVKLLTSDRTPPEGTDYALTARFVGGAVLNASASNSLPAPGELVQFQLKLTLNGQNLPIQHSSGTIRTGENPTEPLALQPVSSGVQGTWQADNQGLVGADFLVTATTPDGVEITRSASLVLDVQPPSGSNIPRISLILFAIAALLLLVLGVTIVVIVLRWVIRRQRA
jgi:pimeloyl-ACP methyl ester carboxylesterase